MERRVLSILTEVSTFSKPVGCMALLADENDILGKGITLLLPSNVANDISAAEGLLPDLLTGK